MRARGTIVGLALAALLGPSATSAAAHHLDDLTPRFPPGPYSALFVDPLDPARVAVGLADGHLAWSSDGATTVDEALVESGREYLSAPYRSAPPLVDLLGVTSRERSQLSGAGVEPPGTRLLLFLMKEGRPIVKWRYWLSIENPEVQLAAIFFPAGNHRPLVATASGIFFGDARGCGWTQSVGAPHPKGRAASGLAVTVDPGDPLHALAGTSGGLLTSRDGGASFFPHRAPELAGREVHDFVWDLEEQRHLLVIADDTVFESTDAGTTFHDVVRAGSHINAVALVPEGAYIATDHGLYLPAAGGRSRRVLADQAIVGVVPLGGGAILVASEEGVSLRSDDGELQLILRTTASDPLLRLRGDARQAWALTRFGIFRISERAPERQPRSDEAAPRVALSSAELERAVLEHTRMGAPPRTRLGAPWQARALPRITLSIDHTARAHDYGTQYQALLQGTAPITTLAEPVPSTTVMVSLIWDLTFLTGTRSPSTPWGLIETNLRATREQILPEVRWRYREAARLAKLLERPPSDERSRLAWRMRLEEHAAYLEAMAGQPVIRLVAEEELQ